MHYSCIGKARKLQMRAQTTKLNRLNRNYSVLKEFLDINESAQTFLTLSWLCHSSYNILHN